MATDWWEQEVARRLMARGITGQEYRRAQGTAIVKIAASFCVAGALGLAILVLLAPHV